MPVAGRSFSGSLHRFSLMSLGLLERSSAQAIFRGGAQWAGLAMVAAMFTLPVAGTALYMVDQYLHPRAHGHGYDPVGGLADSGGKGWQAVPFWCLAIVLHPLMGALGISFCCHSRAHALRAAANTPPRSSRGPVADSSATVAGISSVRLGYSTPPSQIWLEIARNRHLLRLYQWEWYEWLGAIAPLLLFCAGRRMLLIDAAKPNWLALPWRSASTGSSRWQWR